MTNEAVGATPMQNDKLVEALEPCPFCGGEAERFTINEEGDNFGGDVICCKRCGASSHVEFGRKENLVSCWNRRAALSRSDDGAGVSLTASQIAAKIEQVSDLDDNHPTCQLLAKWEPVIRHDERKKIIAQGCIHTRKASENDGYDRPDLSAWQEAQGEYFDPTILEIISEYAAWRDTHPPAAALLEALGRWQEWYHRATADDDCEYLNGDGWADASEIDAQSSAALSEAPSAGEGSAKTPDADGGEA